MAEAPTPLVDYHCHLDLYPDYRRVFRECAQENIQTLAMTTTPRAWPHNRELAGDCPALRVALGLHPQLVAERGVEMALFERYLPETRFVGEVGLDASPRFYGSFEEQVQVFSRVLRLCQEAGGRVISVHSVRAAARVLRMAGEHLDPRRSTIVLHWFTGKLSEAERALELGCYFSVNPRMLSTKPGRELVVRLPLGSMLTETDGPFVEVAGRPAHPRDVAGTLQAIAALRGVNGAEVRAAMLNNMLSLEARHHFGP